MAMAKTANTTNSAPLDYKALLKAGESLRADFESQQKELAATLQSAKKSLEEEIASKETELEAIPGKVGEALRSRDMAKVAKLKERADYLPIEIAFAKEKLAELELEYAQKGEALAQDYFLQASKLHNQLEEFLRDVEKTFDTFAGNITYHAKNRAITFRDIARSHAPLKLQKAQEESKRAGDILINRHVNSLPGARNSSFAHGLIGS